MSYQDFVIKKGKFIGEFEKMYKTFDNPWGQSNLNEINNSISRLSTISYINTYNIDSIVEVGCGLGHTTNLIKERTNTKIIGIDISKTSIKKAKKNYPNLTFKQDIASNISLYSQYECVFFSEITWYLLENKQIEKIFNDIKKNFKGKYFIHNLVFYKGLQKYGNHYFENLEEFISFCPFTLLQEVRVNNKKKDVIETSCIFKIT